MGRSMRYSAEHKQETRLRIMDAAGQLFRKQGYGGSGIDGLTQAAGVTNGAFYGHFKTKSEAFRIAVLAGLDELRTGIVALKAEQGKDWLTTFVGYYLGPKRTCDLGHSCALPSLSPDVMRADRKTRTAYEAELLRILREVSSGLPEALAGERDDTAIAVLALLSGGVTMARAVRDPAVSERIAEAVRKLAMRICAEPKSVDGAASN
jgi:TetR/AcrR family transcriptional regulator, transcriptional repressor for nem operon